MELQKRKLRVWWYLEELRLCLRAAFCGKYGRPSDEEGEVWRNYFQRLAERVFRYIFVKYIFRPEEKDSVIFFVVKYLPPWGKGEDLYIQEICLKKIQIFLVGLQLLNLSSAQLCLRAVFCGKYEAAFLMRMVLEMRKKDGDGHGEEKIG